jgi:hypothetical protein
VNDFRKICAFESYTPTDNVSELTARINDEGWETSFEEWLKGSRLSAADAVLVFSVGGGNGRAPWCQPRGGLLARCRTASSGNHPMTPMEGHDRE